MKTTKGRQVKTSKIQANRDSRGRLLPGNTANLQGRPKKDTSITETIRSMMTEKPEIKRALGTKVLDMAIKGDITAMKLVWNYLDGMPVQRGQVEMVESISDILDRQETDYERLGQEADKQMVADKPLIQDKKQTGESSNLQAEQNSTATSVAKEEPPAQSDPQS